MHRLWRLRPGLSRVGDFCAGRPSREVEAIYGTQRELREGRQVHARRVRQAPNQVALGLLCRLTVFRARENQMCVRRQKAAEEQQRFDKTYLLSFLPPEITAAVAPILPRSL